MSSIKKKEIPYQEVITIIKNCQEKRTQISIALQYAFACRVGELANGYKHSYYKKSKRGFEPIIYESEAPKQKHFSISNENTEISFLKPNFKQAKLIKKDRVTEQQIVTGVDHFPSFLIRTGEPYLFDLIKDYLKTKQYEDPIIDLKQAMLRRIIDKELKKYNPNWSSHWLRHSRAWHIGSITGDPYAVQAVLGHGDLNTSLKYVSKLQRSLRDAFKDGRTMESYLGGVL